MITNPDTFSLNIDSLAALSILQLQTLIQDHPYAGIYKLYLAKKMGDTMLHDAAIVFPDRVYTAYFYNQGSKIPCIGDIREDLEKENIVHQEMPDNIMMANMLHNNTTDDTSSNNIIVVEESTPQVALIDDQKMFDFTELEEDNIVSQKDKTEILNNKQRIKQKKFKLKEYSGISDFSLWLLSFKKDDIDKKIKREEKAAKKKLFEENARKSVTRSASIISEPLAEILASQGHLDDAKKMYEQLMVKYPEKSSYFAAKINNLIKI